MSVAQLMRKALRRAAHPIRHDQKTSRRLLLEQLEDRMLLSGNHVFGRVEGAVTDPAVAARIPIVLDPADFTLAGANAVLGFHVASAGGSHLDPAQVTILDSRGRKMAPAAAFNNIPRSSDSLVLASLPGPKNRIAAPKNYTVLVKGQSGTSGAFTLEIFLAGDRNGDRLVNAKDTIPARDIGAKVGSPRYRIEADANLDGKITAFDQQFVTKNVQDRVRVQPLAMTLEVNPPPIARPDGSFQSNTAQIVLRGAVTAGATVALDSDGDGSFDDGALVAADGTYSFPVTLPDRVTTTISLRATDRMGQQIYRSMRIAGRQDQDAPVIQAQLANDTGADGPNNDRLTNDPTIVGTIADAAAIQAFEARLDGAPAGFVNVLGDLQNATFQLGRARLEAIRGAPLTDGPHILSLRATDAFGNVSAVHDVAFTFDTSAPQTIITTPPNNLLTGHNVMVTGQVTDPAAKVEGRIDNGPFFSVTLNAGAFSFATVLPEDGSQDGVHTVAVRSTDAAGNVSSLATAAFTLDTGAPHISITAPANATLTNRNVAVTGQVTGDPSSVQARIDGGAFFDVAFAAGAYSFNTNLALDGSADGSHLVEVKATDLAANVSTLASTTFTLDTLAPQATITAPLNNSLANQNVAVIGQVAGGASVAEARIDGGAFFPIALNAGGFTFNTNFALNGSQDGAHTVEVRTTDAAGNVSSLASVAFVLDTIAPAVTINAPANGAFTNQNVTVSGQVAGDAVRVQARVDGGAFFDVALAAGPYAFNTNFALNGSADGPHVMEVKATDLAGNVSALAVITVTLDTQAPQPAIATPANGSVTNHNVAVSGQVAGGASTLQARIDSGAFFDVALNSGAFSFNSAFAENGSQDGAHLIEVRASDAAGNLSSLVSVAFTLDTQAPQVVITAPLNNPLTNANSAVTGQVAGGASVLRARLDGGAFFDVAMAAGVFSFNTDLPLDGSRDGSHTVEVQATDEAGNLSNLASTTFTLDSTAPTTPVFDLSIGSDTGNIGDHETESAKVTLVGVTAPGMALTLLESGATALASNTGAFVFPNVDLALDLNTFTIQARDPAGNTSHTSRQFTRVAATGQADPVLTWNAAALEAIRLDADTPPEATRGLAMLHSAILDAVNAIEGTPGRYVSLPTPAGTSGPAAVTEAAFTVLKYLYPAQEAAFAQTRAQELAQVPDGLAKEAGKALGQAVAETIIELRRHDGHDAFVEYVTAGAPGEWVPTAPMFAVPLLPQWGEVAPFVITNTEMFFPDGPPDLSSQEWADAFNEVKTYSTTFHQVPTGEPAKEETKIARFWADGLGTYTPPGHWNQIAGIVAAAEGNSLASNARLFAELNVALADAAILCWDVKYTDGFWRPITAMRNADTDGNDQTTADPSWTPLIVTPPFPEYVSGHSTFSGAAAAILTSFFGDDVAFTVGSFTPTSLVRSFTSFDQAAAEAALSRLYGGIHYRFSNEDGLSIGREVAQFVLNAYSSSSDTQAPAIILEDTPGAAGQNFTIQGRILDNLAGLQSATLARDQGAPVPLQLDANGRFSLSTALATDGSADGAHVFHFRATDAAGNVSTRAVAFTLDTTAPSITITSPHDLDALSAGSRLVGVVGGTGSAIVQLSYAFDAGTPHPLVMGLDGAFDELLDVSQLGVGNHTLTLSARDAAGNSSTNTIDIGLSVLPDFIVSAHTPQAGSSDVGVTFRPQVFFSRAVNTATLNSNNLYATDTAGQKLPATIVPAADGSFAWLFFAGPMPGASTITVHVDGASIRAQAGDTLLDADGTPGGDLAYSFSTVSLAPIPGTTIRGVVADPGPDLLPGTFDDVRPGADGVLMTEDDVYLSPIANVKVFIIGLEAQAVFSNAQGFFQLAAVPSGNVKLVLDGLTATNAPEGIYFPEMVMDVNIFPGVANTVMAAMEPDSVQAAAMHELGVYLPRLRTSILQHVNPTQETMISVDAVSAPDLTPEERQFLTLEVQPQSILGLDGQPLANPQIGISTVPPELVRDMLPPGLLQHTFDITIQAPGAATFDTPLQMTFPNVFNAAPGTKLNFLSFDHTTGRLVIEGTATVSADGQFVVTDADTGITKPGWHGVTPPGSNSEGPPPDEPPPPLDWSEIASTLNGDYASKQGSTDAALAHQIACIAMVSCENASSWGGGFVQSVMSDIARQTMQGSHSTNIPNWVPFGNELAAVLGGFGYHFPSQLLPSFIAHCNALNADDHDSFFDQAVVPCFDEVVAAGELAPWAGAVAKATVPIAAAALRETIQALCPFLSTAPSFEGGGGEFSGGGASGTFGVRALAAIENEAPLLPPPPTQAELFSMDLAALGNLRVEAADSRFFVRVGDQVQLRITKQNPDGSTVDLTAAAMGSQYHVVVFDSSLTISQDGLLSVNETTSPFTSMTPVVYVVVRNGDDFGFGQFAVTDVDANGNAIVDSWDAMLGIGSDSMNLRADLNRLTQEMIERLPNASYEGQRGSLFYALENLENGFVLRGRGDANGAIGSVFLAANTSYRVWTFDLSAGRVGSAKFTSAASGRATVIPVVQLGVDVASDTDEDRLSDVAEFIVGTSRHAPDTDGDGIRDFAELEQRLDPLGGRGLSTGIISSVSLSGSAAAIVLDGSMLSASETTAYVATGSYGLAIVDVSTFTRPTLLSQLDLPGDATDIAVDSQLGIAALASNDGGLHLIDVSNPSAPRLLSTINVPAAHVEVLDGTAYVAVNGELRTYDLVTGALIQTLASGGSSELFALSGAPIRGLAREGGFLYTVDSNGLLNCIDISTGQMQARGSLSMPVFGSNKLTVGGGIAYLAAESFNGGFATANVSNPDNLVLLSGVDAGNIPGKAIAVNGSGLAVVVGSPANLGNSLAVMDVSNPADTGAFLTQYTLPADPFDVAIGAGIAFVAGGTAGLQVVNYRAFDNLGQPPTVAISTPVADVDPSTPGIQVVEGGNIPIQVAITDDVQVRNAELLVNGQVVLNDVSFPFDFSAIAVGADPNAPTVSLQVRATDTGGNIALSNTLVLDLVPDTFPPSVQQITQTTGLRGEVVIRILFDEALAVASVNSANFQLQDGAGATIPQRGLRLQKGDREVQLTYAGFVGLGNHVAINVAAVTDRAGNPLTGFQPPSITSAVPADGSVVAVAPASVRVNFSEAIQIASLIGQNFTLRDVLSGATIPVQVIAVNANQGVDLLPAAALSDGRYEAIVHGAALKDSDNFVLAFNDARATAFDVETAAPTIVEVAPRNHAVRGDDFRVVEIRFSEPMDPGDLTASNLKLLGPGGVAIAPQTIEKLNGNRTARLTYGLLTPGDYQIVIHAAGVTDRFDHPLGGADVVSDFTIVTEVPGLFPGQVSYTGLNPNDLALGDFNGDGVMDAVTVNSAENGVSLLLGFGNGQYRTARDFAANLAFPLGVATGDVNEDGKLDAVVTGNASFNGGVLGVAILLGNGDGTLAAPQLLPNETLFGAGPVALGDVTGDGVLDIVAASNQAVAVFAGLGNAAFAAAIPYDTAGHPTDVALRDIDGDDDRDILVTATDAFGSNLMVLKNSGNGTFPGRVNSAGGAPVRLVQGDINGDGAIDLITATYRYALGSRIAVMLGQGAGSFAMPAIYPLSQASISDVSVGDLDGDGDLDIVAVVGRYSLESAGFILLGNGNGTFQEPTAFEPGASQVSSVLLGDFNGDGDVDVLLGTSDAFQGLHLLLGNGDGTVGAATSFQVNMSVDMFVQADLNGDGNLDVVLGRDNFFSGQVRVLLGDGDGHFAPQPSFTGGTGALAALRLGDVDGDGNQDLLTTSRNGSILGDITQGDITLFLGDGAGGFGPGTVVAHSDQFGFDELALSDVDADGDLDIAFTGLTRFGFVFITPSSHAGFALGNGDGTFQNVAMIIAGESLDTMNVAAGDFTGDGAIDLAFSRSFGERVTIYTSNGAGGYVSAVSSGDAFAVGGQARALALGDINGDGKLDAATANVSYGFYGGSSDPSVSVLLGQGNGAFGQARVMAGGNSPRAIALDDLNADGKVDMVVADLGNDRITVFAGRGDGDFLAGNEHVVGDGPTGIAIHDVDGDGDKDILTANGNDSSLSILRNPGNGEFPNRILATLGDPIGVAAADLNGDGIQDLISADSPGFLSIYLGIGNGSYQQVQRVELGKTISGLALGDLDGDSDLDIVTINYSVEYSFAVLLSNGNGTFTALEETALETGFVQAIALADLNGDGKLDLALTGPESVAIGLGQGNGGFSALETFATDPVPAALVVADVSGDSIPDLLTANSGGAGSVSVLVGIGDGSFADRVDYAVPGLATGLSAGDIDGDGDLDVLVRTGFGNNSSELGILRNRGDGTFPRRIDHTDGAPVGIAKGDLNDDGHLDLVTANRNDAGGTLSVFLGDGTGALGLPATTDLGAVAPVTLSLADFDEDLVPDVVVAVNSDSDGKGVLQVLLGDGAGGFGTPTELSLAAAVTAVAVGDMDGDGHADLIVAFGSNVKLFLGNGDGTFAAGQTLATGTLRHLRLADVDEDGDLDLIAFAGFSIPLLRNNGTGTLAAVGDVTFSSNVQDLELADLSGDGHLDLIIGHSSGFQVLQGDGNGGFSPSVQAGILGSPFIPGLRAIEVGDVDGDGKLDVVAANDSYYSYNSASAINVLFGAGDGALGQPVVTPTGNVRFESLVLDDFDDDGKLDFAAASNLGRRVAVGLGTGAGTFAVGEPAESLNAGPNVLAAATGDVNGDGKLDVVVSKSNGRAAVILGNGDGSFQPRREYALGTNPQAIVLRDLDADGDLDLLAGNTGNDTLAVLFNAGNGAYPGEALFINGASRMAAGDLNADGNTDLVVLNNSDTVAVLLGNPDGTFQAPSQFPAFAFHSDIKLVDINGDAKLDAVVVGRRADFRAAVGILLGDGAGAFGNVVEVTAGENASRVAVGDVTGDGILDLVTANAWPSRLGRISVLQGMAGGGYETPIDYEAQGSPVDVNLSDTDADGDLDVLLATSDVIGGGPVGRVLVLDNLGGGVFPGRINDTLGFPAQVLVGDFNGDGLEDLATVNSSYGGSDGDAAMILLGQADGAYQRTANVNLGGSRDALDMALADLDGDGNLDMVVLTRKSDNSQWALQFLQGNGDGTLAAAVESVFSNATPSSLVLDDADGDGKLDAILSGIVSFAKGHGDGTFGDAASTFVNASRIAMGDLNGDGFLDLVGSGNGFSQIRVALGDGNGDFGGGQFYNPGTGFVRDLRVGDMDNDGDLDVVVNLSQGIGGSSSLVFVLLGNGDGTLAASLSTTAQGGPLQLGDVNGDGKLDAVMSGFSYYGPTSAGGVSVLLGNGDGTLAAPLVTETGGLLAQHLALADLNGDGKLDVALASSDGRRIQVLHGDGTGAFHGPEGIGALDLGTNSPRALAIGDVNGDGVRDLVVPVSTTSYAGSAGAIAVLLGRPTGGFEPVVFFQAGVDPRDVVLGDVDGDGRVDIVVSNGSANRAAVLLGNNDGTFRARAEYQAGNGPTELVLEDVDGDGDLDIIVLETGAASVRVLRNNSN